LHRPPDMLFLTKKILAVRTYSYVRRKNNSEFFDFLAIFLQIPGAYELGSLCEFSEIKTLHRFHMF
jgi:hypothetical protein